MSIGLRGGVANDGYIQINGIDQVKVDSSGNLTLGATSRLIAPNTLIQTAYNAYNSAAGYTNSLIPFDNTIPQITEGSVINAITITPKSATSRLRVRFNGNVNSNTVCNIQAALFVGPGNDAVSARSITLRNTTDQYGILLEWEGVTGTTLPLTIQLRMGTNINAIFACNTIVGVSPIFNGVSFCTLIAEEYTPA